MTETGGRLSKARVVLGYMHEVSYCTQCSDKSKCKEKISRKENKIFKVFNFKRRNNEKSTYLVKKLWNRG